MGCVLFCWISQLFIPLFPNWWAPLSARTLCQTVQGGPTLTSVVEEKGSQFLSDRRIDAVVLVSVLREGGRKRDRAV